MKKTVFGWWAGLLLGLLLPVAIAPAVHADTSDFVITKFSAEETLSRADPQGELHIVEDIQVDFHDYNHGILRALPNTYAKHRLQLHLNKISSPSGAPARYSTYQSHGNTVLKIGDPKQTVTGAQEYIIDYTMRNVITFFGDHDELYWNINGDQWPQPFASVQLTLHLPDGLESSSQGRACYTGPRGSTAHHCIIALDGQEILSETTQGLPGDETLTIVAGFQKGYFRPSTWYETLQEYQTAALQIGIPFVLLAGTAGVFWFRRGRDPKGRGVIVPEYDAPDGLKPLEVGTVIDFRADNRDLTATIIDLAIRGYIKIIEETKDRALLPDKHTYLLELRKSDQTELTTFERKLLTAIFSSYNQGEQVSLSSLKNKLFKVAGDIRKDVSKDLVARQYFRPSPFYGSGGLLAFVWPVVWLASIILFATHMPVLITIGLVAGTFVAALFLFFSTSRTAQGVAAKEHILGLKLYMNVAEADRLKMLQSPDAPYAPRSSAPAQTVELFEKLLPYAMALGVEKGWAKKFEDIYRMPPDWYNGNWTTFNAVYLASSLNSGVGNAINTAFSAPGGSGGSGFGGGAGGGGGGGGGGGW